jgi:phenylacetic acid degradation operon negative regulatory protein
MTYFYHAVLDSPHLPRELEHDSTQNMVVTLLGEFWSYSPALAVPSAGIVELLKRMDITDVAARAALSRLARRGTLVVSRTGRNTSYCLAEDVAATIPASETLTMSFGQEERDWNGEWTVIVFSMPETQRDRRQALREWLRWLGFGPARDGVWISPHADVSLMVSPADALKISLTILAKWRGFPTVDPDLPQASLPADWPRREARRLFIEVYDECTPLAEIHVKNVIAKHDLECAGRVRGLTVKQTIEHYRASAAPAR